VPTEKPINANAPGEGSERGTSWTNDPTLCRSPKSVKSKSQKGGIFFSKQTIDMLLRIPKKYRSDAMALLMFYHYIACWQGTHQPRATVPYVMQGLGWGKNKVKAVRSVLRKLGLIETVRATDRRGKIKGHYVGLRYFQPMNYEAKTTSPVLPPVVKQTPKCFGSDTVKCLKADKTQRSSLSLSEQPNQEAVLNESKTMKDNVTPEHIEQPYYFIDFRLRPSGRLSPEETQRRLREGGAIAEEIAAKWRTESSQTRLEPMPMMKNLEDLEPC
jgi:hypothetical protein